ncbi:MAG: cbb3-type cytochrome c oxidase subunit I [Halohasta sp.]
MRIALASVALFAGAFVVAAVLLARRAAAEPPDARLVSDGGVGAYLPGRWRGFEHKPGGIVRWLTTVDHKDIGILYILFGIAAGTWGATDGMMMRAELFTADPTIWDPQTYNAVFTMHGLTMLFFFVTPVFFGFANYFIPILLDAEDMAFPRINAIAFWLIPMAFLLARAGLLTEVLGKMLLSFGIDIPVLLILEPPASGWTMYVPLSTTLENPQMDLLLLGLHLSGLATVMGAVNIIVTIFTMRGEGVNWSNLDIFSWTLLTTSGIVLFAFPLLGSALLMLLVKMRSVVFTSTTGAKVVSLHLSMNNCVTRSSVRARIWSLVMARFFPLP